MLKKNRAVASHSLVTKAKQQLKKRKKEKRWTMKRTKSCLRGSHQVRHKDEEAVTHI